MNMNKRIAAKAMLMVLGAVMAVCSAVGMMEEFWGGMGVALIVAGGIQLMRMIRYKTNSDYRARVNVEKDDERNRYISMKAWSMAGYMFVLIAGVATITLKIAGRDELMGMASAGMCLMLVLYWGSWMVLRRKY